MSDEQQQLHPAERIWYEDPVGFLDPSNMVRFFPIKKMTQAEQLNAVLRFSIYFSLILLIAGRGSHVLFLPIATAGGTYLMSISRPDIQEHLEEPSADGDALNKSKKSSKNSKNNSKKPCALPTKDNPFMNVLMNEYAQEPDRGSACDITDPATVQSAEAQFDKGVVRDSDDIFHRRASSRQFVTNPATTIPNDQGAFASWLYGDPPACKTKNRSHCTYRT